MKLALIVGAQPKSCKDLSIVRLPAGKWKLCTEGIVDSLFSFRTGDSHFKLADKITIENEAPTFVQFFMDHRGTESCISIFAELVT